MEYKKNDTELRRLVSSLCDGFISAEEYERLEKLLVDNQDARHFYYDYVTVHAELSWSNAAGESHKTLLSLEAGRTESDEGTNEVIVKKSPVLGFLGDCFEQGFGTLEKGGSLWALLLAFLGVGAVFSILMLCIWSGRDEVAGNCLPPKDVPAVQSPIARLVETVDCKWSKEADQFDDNSELSLGQVIKLDSGLAKIAFDGLAEVIVEGPAEFCIESPMSAKLMHGRLSAKVTDKGHGFTIHGPKMRVLDLGTEFGLNIDDDGRGQVHVFKGEVEVALMRHDGRAIRSQLITQYKAASLDSQDGKIGDLRIDPAEFIRTFEASDLDITREYVQSVKSLDPVAYWRFEYLDNGLVLNEMSDRYHGHSPTRLVLSRDVQNKTLAVDQRRDDKQYMVVEEPLEELVDSDVSIEFWIKPDEYQRTTPVMLLRSNTLIEGHEMVANLVELLPADNSEHGQPTHVLRLLHRIPASWTITEGINCYSDEEYRPGYWHHIVGVFDGRHMRLYLNAKLVASAAINGRINFAPCVSIGRPRGCISKVLREVNKEMVGQIDEVAIYNKALSNRQVAEHYRLGKNDSSRPAIQ